MATRGWQKDLNEIESGEAVDLATQRAPKPESLSGMTVDQWAEQFLSSPRGEACTSSADAIEAAKLMLCNRYGTDAWRLAQASVEIAIACAWNRRAAPAQFAAAITSPAFSHVSVRTWCGVESAYVYHHSPTSPSGVLLAAALPTDQARPILAAHGTPSHHGPQRGDLANA